MEKFYRVLPSLPGLGGLIVRGCPYRIEEINMADVVEVVEIITNAIIGDRDLKFPIPRMSLWINDEFLEEVEDPTKEYSTKSPFGKYLSDGTIESDGIHIAYTVFDNAVTVTIYELQSDKSQKTLYSQNFFGQNRDVALDSIADVTSGETPAEDLSLILQEIG